MVRNTDVAELKRKLTVDKNTFGKYITAVVGDNGQNWCHSKLQSIWNMDENLLKKYLKLIKQVYPRGAAEDRILTVKSPKMNGMYGLFCKLIQEEEVTDTDIDNGIQWIVNNYMSLTPYVIMILTDVYDVITRTTDNIDLDESEEVYSSVLCLIMPLKLSKQSIMYEGKFGWMDGELISGTRNWEIQKPEYAWQWPAFDTRSADQDEVMLYVADPGDVDHDVMTEVLCAKDMRTATEKCIEFQCFLRNHLRIQDADDEMAKINKVLESIAGDDPEKVLTGADVEKAMKNAGIDPETAEITGKDYTVATSKGGDIKACHSYVGKKVAEADEIIRKEKLKSLMRRASDVATLAGNEDLAAELQEFSARE